MQPADLVGAIEVGQRPGDASIQLILVYIYVFGINHLKYA